jgi:hypothetical protein
LGDRLGIPRLPPRAVPTLRAQAVISAGLVSGMRWLFWGLVYVATATFLLVLVVVAIPEPVFVRWTVFGALIGGLVWDARVKARR